MAEIRDQDGHTVTALIARWQGGDDEALNLLMARVYAQLRRLARRCLIRERPDHTFESCDLVHEAFLRLHGQRGGGLQNRAQFLAVAAAMMRRTLVDRARRRRSAKRGGGPGALHQPEPLAAAAAPAAPDLLPVHEALEELAALDPALATVVELRFFAGLDHDELAGLLGISSATARRRWRLARAWLHGALRRDARPPAP